MSERRAPFLDVYVGESSFGHEVFFVWRGGEPARRIIHEPWFTVYAHAPPSGVKVEAVEGVPLIWDDSTMLYLPFPELRVFRVKAPSKDVVPVLASKLLSQVEAAGLYNIRYEVRVAYDTSDMGILGLPTPLAFLPNREMVELLVEALERSNELKVLAFDVEVLSRTGGFPRRGDPLLSIAYMTFTLSDNEMFAPETPWERVHVLRAPHELVKDRDWPELEAESDRLVAEFERVLEREKPDIVVTYNGESFDFPYIQPFALRARFRKRFVEVGGRFFPHLDLLVLREYHGSSLGMRSHTAFSLVDVALDVIRGVARVYGLEWLFESELIEAERKLNHTVLGELYAERNPLLEAYIRADVYLTALLARFWLYPVMALSALTGIPPTVVKELNTGQVAEYLVTELLARLGYYPELRMQRYRYSRTSSPPPGRDTWVYTRGKVYARDYGLFGGDGKRVVELDYNQLYPSDMVVNSSDPTSIYIVDVGPGSPVGRTSRFTGLRLFKEKRTEILLSEELPGGKRRQFTVTVAPGYGPVSWFVYKLYEARMATKRLKKRAKDEGKPELAAVDQAVKILNNSMYGSTSKSRGNLINELIGASVFWRTQRLFYRTKDYIERGLGHPVLYGDTDSTYILVDESVSGRELEREVNEWLAREYNPLYSMKLEDEYDLMVIPKQKGANRPSAKSYITFKGGRPAKVKGEFYKLEAPVAVKEKLDRLYTEIVLGGVRTRAELEEMVRRLMAGEPPYKWFIKKSVASFVNEDDSRLLKNLVRHFHYAALFQLALEEAEGVRVLSREERWGSTVLTVEVDPRAVERTQKVVIVRFLPHPARRDVTRFLVYAGETGAGLVRVYSVRVVRAEKLARGESEKDKYEYAYRVTFAFQLLELPPHLMLQRALQAVRRYVVDTLYEKLVKAINKAESIYEYDNSLSPSGPSPRPQQEGP